MELSVQRLIASKQSWRAGLALMVIGSLTLAIGAVQSTAAIIQPSCPEGTVLVAKFNRTDGNYVFEKPAGNSGVVTITNGTGTGGNWSSSQAISNIVVKGGPGSITVSLTPAALSGSFSNTGLPPVGKGNTPAISNIQFCASTIVASSTTAAPTTTVVVGTTADDSSSTTADDSSSTTADDSSSTTADESTTSGPASTSRVSTTTQPGSSSTGLAGASSTTVALSTTTAAVLSVTSISKDDNVQVLADGTARPLAFTGSASVPMVVGGIVLLGMGAALIILNRLRERRIGA